MIEVRELVKSFGPCTALAGIDLSVECGEIVAIVGPNGAGKTTLLRVLATLARPTSGTACIARHDLAHAGEEVRRCIGFLSHRTLLYEDLSAEQNLRFYARLYDLPDAADRIAAVLDRVGLSRRRDELVRNLSRGMQQRLALARTVLHGPEVLLLDEPYTGLDPNAVQMLTDLLLELAREGRTVLLTTHNLERALEVGQRLVVLTKGRLVYDAHREAICAATFPDTVRELTV